jgi:hypothetical protein
MGIIRKNRWYRSVVECSKRWVQSPVLKGKKKKDYFLGMWLNQIQTQYQEKERNKKKN